MIETPILNQTNLAILLDALREARWHFDMAHVFSKLITKHFLGTSIVERIDCGTAACIHGTIKLLNTASDTVDSRVGGEEQYWLGVSSELYSNIIMPTSYKVIAHETPEPIQRAAAIAMLEDLARGAVPTENWLLDYIEEIEREAPLPSRPNSLDRGNIPKEKA